MTIQIGDPVTGQPYRVGGGGIVAGGSFTLPANTTFASGQLIANSNTNTSVTPITVAAARASSGSVAGGGTGRVKRVRVSTNKTGMAGTEIVRVHFFKNLPTVANGNGGAFSVNGVGAIWLGHADVTLSQVFNDGSKGIAAPAIGQDITFDAAANSANIYALLEARSAITGTSGDTWAVAVECHQD